MTAVVRLPRDIGEIAQILTATAGSPLLPTRADRDHWRAFAGQPIAEEVIALAEEAAAEPMPVLRASEYLAYRRTGDRAGYEAKVDARHARLIHMALAECLEAEGRYVDAILDGAWAICEESTWVVPAHAGEYPHGLWHPEVPIIDLWSAMTVLTLAELDHLLAAVLEPALRKRIRYEVRRRGTQPFLDRDDYFWSGPLGPGHSAPNWGPVCAGSVAGAALYLEQDVNTLARVLARALETLDHYLGSFAPDGGCAEGIGYWEKGFGYFAVLADLLAKRTDGRIDLMAEPLVREVARFPLKAALGPGAYAGFSDTGIGRWLQAALLHQLSRRAGEPALTGLDHEGTAGRRLTRRYPPEKIRDFVWYPARHGAAPAALSPADYLPDTGWLVVRANPADPDGLVLAVKAGHNGEPHNHNDVGSFMVHWRGESLIAELGAAPYTGESFRKDTRYRILNNRSLGHSVPLVNGFEQAAGAAHAARDVRPLVDGPDGIEIVGLSMDLAPAYPAGAGLLSLRRSLRLRRQADGPGWIELEDIADFDNPPAALESALITFARVDPDGPGALRLVGRRGAVRLCFECTDVAARWQSHPGVALRHGPQDVTRIAVAARQPTICTRITIRIDPVDSDRTAATPWESAQ